MDFQGLLTVIQGARSSAIRFMLLFTHPRTDPRIDPKHQGGRFARGMYGSIVTESMAYKAHRSSTHTLRATNSMMAIERRVAIVEFSASMQWRLKRSGQQRARNTLRPASQGSSSSSSSSVASGSSRRAAASWARCNLRELGLLFAGFW